MCFIRAYSCSSPPFVGLLAELSLGKVCECCSCFNFLLSGMFKAPLWVPACSVLVCGEARNDQLELLRIGNFRGLSAGTADGPLDVIFSVWGVVCSSKGYMSRLCWLVPIRHNQALKKCIYYNLWNTKKKNQWRSLCHHVPKKSCFFHRVYCCIKVSKRK